LGFKVIGPDPGSEPERAPLDAGSVCVPFNETDWGWLHDALAEAHRQDRITVKPQVIVREAVHQLSQQGGWGAIRDAVLRRRLLEPRAGRKLGSKTTS
jgi:hypothetical protein